MSQVVCRHLSPFACTMVHKAAFTMNATAVASQWQHHT